MSDVRTLYPNQYYAQYDTTKTPSPITGWWNMWVQSCDPSLLPKLTELFPLAEDQWQDHINNNQSSKAIQDGKIVDYTPKSVQIPLKDQAQYALQNARTTVYNNFGILNEPTPDAWVSYLKTLMNIVNGTDTTSTKLPEQPSDLTT